MAWDAVPACEDGSAAIGVYKLLFLRQVTLVKTEFYRYFVTRFFPYCLSALEWRSALIFPSLFGKLRALRENPDFMTTPSPPQIAKKTKFKLPTAYHQSLIFGDK
jgi:hypothetical protein